MQILQIIKVIGKHQKQIGDFMFFSVIVPVYNVEEYLHDCIKSVLNQTFDDFELILVDDGSPDNCPLICDEYAAKDNRIKVIHKENGGLASARREGIKQASGEYVYNLDSDDLIETDTLEFAYNKIKETNCEIVTFAYNWVKNGKVIKITDDCVEEGFYSKDDIMKKLYPMILMDKNMNHLSFYLSGKAIKRKLIAPLQLAVDEKISLGEDLCCSFPCVINAESIYISKKASYLYNVRENSMSKEFNTKQILLLEDVINELSKNNTSMINDFEEQLHRYSCFMCFTVLASAAEGNYRKSIKKIKSCILNSIHSDHIKFAVFDKISLKSKISIFLMKIKLYNSAFCFLRISKFIKNLLKRS